MSRQGVPILRVVLTTVLVLGSVFASSGFVVPPARNAPVDFQQATPPVLGPWQTISTLQIPRKHHATVVVGNRIYVVGGIGTTDVPKIKPVEMAVIQSDGSLSPWTLTSSLSVGRANLAVLQIGTFLYAIGGQGETNVSISSIERAEIQADGTLGTWSVVSTLSAPLEQFEAVTSNGYVYVIGGTNVLNRTAKVERAAILPDGSISVVWEPLASLNAARSWLKAIVYNGSLYLTGGFTGSGTLFNTVERATIAADGSLGPWQLQMPLNNARATHGLVQIDGYLYAMGAATTGNQRTNTVEQATVAPDGSITKWTVQPYGLLQSWLKNGVVAYGHSVYAIGGENGTGALVGSVDRATVPPSNQRLFTPAIPNGVVGG